MTARLTPESISSIFYTIPLATWRERYGEDKRGYYEAAWAVLNDLNSMDAYVQYIKDAVVRHDLEEADDVIENERVLRSVYFEYRPRTRALIPRVLARSVTASEFHIRSNESDRMVLIAPLKFRTTQIEHPTFEYVKRFNIVDSDDDDGINFNAQAQPLLLNMFQRSLSLTEANKRIMDNAANIVQFRGANFNPNMFQPITNLANLGNMVILREATRAWFSGMFKTFTYFFGTTNSVSDVIALLARTNLPNAQLNAVALNNEVMRITNDRTVVTTFDRNLMKRVGADILRVDSAIPSMNITFRAHILIQVTTTNENGTDTYKTTARQPIIFTYRKRNKPSYEAAVTDFNEFIDSLTNDQLQFLNRETPLPGSDRIRQDNELEVWTKFVSVDITHVNVAVGVLTRVILKSLLSIVQARGSSQDLDPIEDVTYSRRQDHALDREVITINISNQLKLETPTDPELRADCVMSAFTLALRKNGFKVRLNEFIESVEQVTAKVTTDAGYELRTISAISDFVAAKYGVSVIVYTFDGHVMTATGNPDDAPANKIEILYHERHAFAITEATESFYNSVAIPGREGSPSMLLSREITDAKKQTMCYLDYETVNGIDGQVLPWALSFAFARGNLNTYLEMPSNTSSNTLFSRLVTKILEDVPVSDDCEGWRHVILSAFNGDRFDFNIMESSMLEAGFRPRGSVAHRLSSKYYNMTLKISLSFSDLAKWSMNSLDGTYKQFVPAYPQRDPVRIRGVGFYNKEREIIGKGKIPFSHDIPQNAFNAGEFPEWLEENKERVTEYVEHDVRILRVCDIKFESSFYDRENGLFRDLPEALQIQSDAAAMKWSKAKVPKKRKSDSRGLSNFRSYPTISSANYARCAFVTSCRNAFDMQLDSGTTRTVMAMIREGAQAGRVSSDMFGVKVECTMPEEGETCVLRTRQLCTVTDGKFVMLDKEVSEAVYRDKSRYRLVSGPMSQIDLVSSYPAQMCNEFPVGPATIVQGQEAVNAALDECQEKGWFYFVTALIKPAEDVAKYGQCMSAYRDGEANGRLKYKHSGEYIRFTNNVELDNVTNWVLPSGADVLAKYTSAFQDQDYWHDESLYSGGPVLIYWKETEAVLKFYIEWLVENKTAAKARGDKVSAEFFKLMVNSISGKMFEHSHNEEVFDITSNDLSSFMRSVNGFTNPYSAFLNVRGRPLAGLPDGFDVRDEEVELTPGDALRHKFIQCVPSGGDTVRVKRVDLVPRDVSPVGIGAIIYSMGREVLWQDGYERGPVWYTDTDSLVVYSADLAKFMRKNPEKFGSALGQWETEGGFIVALWPIAPKTYCIKFEDGRTKPRAKGIRKNTPYTIDGRVIGMLYDNPVPAFDALLDPRKTVSVENGVFMRNPRTGVFERLDTPKKMRLRHVDPMNIRGGYSEIVNVTVGRVGYSHPV